MKRTHIRKILSVSMALILLFCTTAAVSVSGGVSFFAADVNASLVDVGEQLNLRGQYEKHFRLEDGSMQAVIYSEPVHYQDTLTGTWVEIDNTLESQVETAGNTVYRNRNGLFDVTFAQTATIENNRLVTVKNDEHTLSWQFVTTPVENDDTELLLRSASDEENASVAQVLSPEKSDEKATVPTVGALIYGDLIEQGTDVRFTVTPTRVKEDILLKSVPSQAVSYTTRLVFSEGLIPTLQDDGTVFVRDSEGVEIFRIAAPYMTDAADEISQEIDVALEQMGNAWDLTITPDWTWLCDEARVYPVVIDPTVYPANNAANVLDTYIYENSTTSGATARQDLDRMYIGNRTSAGENKCRGLLCFNTMPQVWGDITSASLTLSTPSGTTSWKNMTLYRVTSAWNCSTVVWPGPNVTAIQSKAAANGLYTFDVTAVMKNIYHNNVNGTNGNYGFEIRYQDETVADYNALRSSEWSDDTLISPSKPYLTITYTERTPYTNIDDTRYYIIKNAASGKVLQVPNLGAAGTFVTEGSENALANQAWKIKHEGSGLYSITPAYDLNLRLNVPSFESVDGKDINVWTDNASSAERWYIQNNGDGTLRFTPYCAKDDNRVLQIEDHTTKPTAEISTWNNSAKQKWYVQRVYSPQSTELTRKGIYYIKNKATGKYLGVSATDYTTPATVGQYTKVQNGTQRWMLGYNDRNYGFLPTLGHNGSFTINQAMEIKDNTVGAGGTLQVASSTGLDQQTFQIRKISAGTYVILTACSGYNMALTAGSGTTVTTSVLAVTGATDAQQWVFESDGDRTFNAVSLGGENFEVADGWFEQYADVKLSKRAFDLFGYEAVANGTPDYFDLLTQPRGVEIVHFSCHGNPQFLKFNAAPNANNSTGVFITIDIWNYTDCISIDNYDDIDNCKLMIFDACSTYLPGEDNDICDAAVDAGVDAVLCWEHETSDEDLWWFEEFYDYLLEGKTIQQAVDLMNAIHNDGNDDDDQCDYCLRNNLHNGACLTHDAKIVGNGDFQLYAGA